MGEQDRIGHDIERLRMALGPLESGCDVLSSPDFKQIN
jgi:hypothetical protein